MSFSLNKSDFYDFSFVDTAKLCAILSTHEIVTRISPNNSSDKNVADLKDQSLNAENEFNVNVYNSFVNRLLCLTRSDEFESGEIDFKLAELFTIQSMISSNNLTLFNHFYFLVLKLYSKLKNEDYYEQVFELFSKTEFQMDICFYVKLFYDMNWIFYGSFMIAATNNSTIILNEIKNLKSSIERNCFVQNLSVYSSSSCSNNYEVLKINEADLILKSISYEKILLLEIFVIIEKLYSLKCSKINVDVLKREDFSAKYNKILFSIKSFLENSKSDECNRFNEELQDCLVLFVCMVNHVNHMTNVAQLLNIQDYIVLENFQKFKFFKKLFYISKQKVYNIETDEYSQNSLNYFTLLCYQIMLNNFIYFHDCPVFVVLSKIDWNDSSTNKIHTLLQQNDFWTILLEKFNLSDLSNKFYCIFDIIDSLDKTNCHFNVKHNLFQLNFMIFMQNKLEDKGFFDQLFSKRIDLFQFNQIVMKVDFKNLFSNQPQEGKFKLDFQNEHLRKFSLKIISSKFAF